MGDFCQWDAKNLGDTIILIVFFVILLIIGSITSYRLKKSKYYGEYGKKTMVIYLLIMAWTTIMTGQLSYSIYVFFAYLYQHPDENIMPYARNYVRFDVLPGFIVQTIFLTICKFYYHGIVGAIQISNLSRWQQVYINYLNLYYVFRIFNQAVGITLVNIFAQSDQISVYTKINICILVIDSVIMNIYLIISLKIFLRVIKYIQTLTNDQVKKLKNQYTLMIATSMLRVVIDVIFVIIPLFDENKQQKCYITDFYQDIIHSILYQILGNLINHFIPIIFILNIYSFKRSESQTNLLTQSEDAFIRSDLQ